MYSLRAMLIRIHPLRLAASVRYATVSAALLLLSSGCAPPPAKKNLKEETPADNAREAREKPLPKPPGGEPDIELSTLAWSPDGQLLLAGYRQPPAVEQHPDEAHRVTVWDVKTGQRLQVLKGHDGNITFVGFLPDSKRAVTAGGSTVKMWDARTGKQLWSAKPHARMIEITALSPDGKFVLSWGPEDNTNDPVRTLKLCDARTGKLIREFEGYEDFVIRRFTFTPDSKFVFVKSICHPGQDIYLRILDASNGRCLESFKIDQAWKYPLAFSPDGKLALSEKPLELIRSDSYLVLWNLASGEVVRRFEDRTNRERIGGRNSHTLAFTPDGKRVLSGDYDCRVRIWDAATGKLISSVDLLDNDPSGMNAQRKGPPEKALVWLFSPNGKMALTSNGSMKGHGPGAAGVMFTIWDVSNGKLVRRFQVEPGYK